MKNCTLCSNPDASPVILNGEPDFICESCIQLLQTDLATQMRYSQIIDKKKKAEPEILVDLTQKEFPRVLFREDETRRLTQILLRKEKSNPILVGEAGTGKTAIVESLAMMVKHDEIPRLSGYKVYALNVGSITAGTKYRGDLEQKIEKIIKQISSEKCILFIDEIHLLTGSGGQDEVNIANLLKPYLARGEVKLIGATTLSEYRRIEKDAAFSRRLLPIRVNELTGEQTLVILQDIRKAYEKHHSVKVSDEALTHIVKLADAYIKDLNFPDKAFDILDEAMSSTSLDNNVKHSKEKKDEVKLSFKTFLKTSGIEEDELSDILFTMDKAELEKMPSITIDKVNKVVELMTGIPLQTLEKQDKDKLRNFTTTLREQVIGQEEATEALSRTVKRSSMKITKKNKPTVLFFAGPTGVGKTEAAKVLTKSLFGSEDALIRFDMSEYMEQHTISRLIGSPPGYIGHDDEGQLTEAVRRKPFSVILLDEFEKAHSAVSKLLLQVFDDGRLTDSKGRVVDFSNTIIIATSNIGTATPVKKLGFGTANTEAVDNDLTMAALKRVYAPEFLNRLDEVITFKSLTEEDLKKIVDIQILKLEESLKEQDIQISLSQEAKNLLAKKGYEPTLGARPLKRVITREVEDLVIDHLLESDASVDIKIDIDGDKLVIS